MSDTHTDSEPQRVFGLDLMRALAVSSVLMGHFCLQFEPPQWLARFAGSSAVLGVEIFYVLSGFLIGSIIIRLARSGRLHSFTDVREFWTRRWARTLPLYYVFLLFYFRFDYHGPAKIADDYQFIIFMQNFAWPMAPFFQHSWSLAVEEWFYILFPVTFLLFAGNERERYATPIVITCLIFMLTPVFFRAILASPIADYNSFDDHIRSVVICRLDSIFYGVLMALVRDRMPDIYDTVARIGWSGFAGVIGFTIYLSIGAPGLIDHDVAKVLLFPVLSITVAIWIPAVERMKTTGLNLLDRLITYTSKVSYSLYLGHIAVIPFVNDAIVMLGFSIKGNLQTFVVYAEYMVTSYALADVTYNFVERPFLKLRDISLPKYTTSSAT
jgi:peptidoglycan/LPS O-acetylase OafA/YrhL